MPPARNSRAAQREAAERAAVERVSVVEDSRSEGSTPGNGTSKRRGAAVGAGTVSSGSGPCPVAGAAGSGATNSNGAHAHEGIDGMDWNDVPIDVLHKYRHAYRVKCPSASPFYSHLIMSQGVGKKTPSRVKERITRETLATAVRKNFNAQPINESDVIVSFLYAVKHQDKSFRLRFSPSLTTTSRSG